MGTTSVSLTDAKAYLGDVVNRAAYGGERVVLLSRGVPKAAIISLEDLRLLEQLSTESGVSPTLMGTWLEESRALRQRILERQGDTFLYDSATELRRTREERTHELTGLR